MGSQIRLTSSDSIPAGQRKPELLKRACSLGIRSAERDKLEAMCEHEGLRHAGLSDAALRRALEAVLA